MSLMSLLNTLNVTFDQFNASFFIVHEIISLKKKNITGPKLLNSSANYIFFYNNKLKKRFIN